MNTNPKTIQKDKCLWCSKVVSNQKYCPYCGRATGRVSSPILSQYKNSPPVKTVEIANGGSFFIRFEHKSGEPVQIECDISNTHNILFKDKPTCSKDSGNAKKAVNLSFEFCLKDERVQPSGDIFFRLDNGEREPDKIWRRKNFNEIKYPIGGKIAVASSEWNLGSEFLFFSNKLERQNICIYNPSSIDRDFVIDPPNGYNIDSIDSFGNIEIPIEASSNAVLSIEKKKMKVENPTYWEVGTQKVELFELPAQKNTNRRKLRISFDLGAKTFSIRACWVGGNNIFSKKNGEVEEIGGKYFSPTMIMDKTGREFYFSEQADSVLSRVKGNSNLVPITGLKTSIRDFNDRYIGINKIWTNEYLLSILFSEVLSIIKNWIEDLFYRTKGSIPFGFKFNEYFDNPEYVFTYPWLETEEERERYQNIFKRAFLTAFKGEDIDESQISFISEPEAVFNYIVSKKTDISATSNGELFVIVDSGAGTTDLSIGKIKKDKGIITLTNIKSISLDLTENQKRYYGINTSHLGGNLLDFIFSYVLDKDASKILKSSAGTIYTSLWDSMWGSLASEFFEEKMKYCKYIKELFEIKVSNADVVQLKVPKNDGTGIKEPVTVDYKAYGETVIEPVLKSVFSEANQKILDMDVDFRKIGMIALVGGSNICSHLRHSIISKMPLTSNATKKDELLTENDRLYSIVEGACIPVEPLFTTSFATFTIKDESNEDREIITEGEAIVPKSFIRNVRYNEANIAILDLFAVSEFWKGTKKVATAISKKSNFDFDNEYALFEIEVSDKKCVCKDGEQNICWDINIS